MEVHAAEEPRPKPLLVETVIVGRPHPIKVALPERLRRRMPLVEISNLDRFCRMLKKSGVPLYEGTAAIINANGCGGRIAEALAPYDFLTYMVVVWDGMDPTPYHHAGDAKSLARALDEMFFF